MVTIGFTKIQRIHNSKLETRHFKSPKTFYIPQHINGKTIIRLIKVTGFFREYEVDTLGGRNDRGDGYSRDIRTEKT